MRDKDFLMIPGPTPVPESVLLALAKHPIGHRSGEFSAILKRCHEGLKWLFQTENDVFIFTASGTGAMCSAMGNLVNRGDKVLSLVIGNFGQRWAKIAKSYGADVEIIEVPYGQAINPNVVRERLAKDVNKEIKIVTVTHNETSTGVTNPIKEIVAAIKEHGALSVVDGITSVGAIDCKQDEWGIDVLVSGSQKGFMIPPGLSFLSASKRAFEVHKQCEYPDFYFNWTDAKKNYDKDTTPWTPAINLIVALDKAFELLKEEGLENIIARHKHNATLLREGVKEMGLKLFVEDESIASYAITAILPPEGISVPDIRKTLKNDYNIVVANGQNDLKDRIFRMGTLGFCSERDVLTALASLKATINKLTK
ncbi:MAG: alanine--glyoxylate aminotransferase family protein [Cyanobacteria bacterium SIG30]|nr:alanine--glyoxylate aminotransferase family protein [Cyanobacteria bacterium SIG30]